MLNFQHRYAWLCGAVLLLFAQCALPAIGFRAAASAAASGATISFRASGAVASANSGNLTARLPAAALGEMFFCQIASRDNVAHSMPAAWTPAYSLSVSPTLRASLFYKISAASEVNPLITHPAGGSIIARCTRFRGVDTSNPLDVAFAAQYAASAATVTSGSLTTISRNDMLLFAAHLTRTPTTPATLSTPAGWTRPYYSRAGNSAIALHYRVQANPALVGPISATAAAAVENYGVLLALRAAANLTINRPTGAIAGDVMVAAITATPASIPITPPAGWTLIQSQAQPANTSSIVATFYRVAGVGEPASYTWILSSAHAGAVGGILSYSGVDNAAPLDVSAKAATPRALTHTAPSVLTTLAGDLLITVHEYASARSWTPPAGMTERVDIASGAAGNAGVTLEMNELLLGVAAATGAKTATAAANSDVGATVSIALRAAILAPHHIEIQHDGAGLTCAAESVTLRACSDAACSSLYTSGGISGTLSPSGSIYNIGSSGISSGTVNPTAAGSYTLSATVSPTPTASPAVSCRNTVSGSSSCTIVFSASGLTLSLPNFPAASGANSATVRATDSNCNGTFNGNRSLRFFSAYTNPSSGTQQISINGIPISILAASPTTLTLNFTNGLSTFNLNYADVGRITLDATDAVTSTRGNGQFVAYPAGFVLSAIQRSSDGLANPSAINAAGAKFVAAGENFSATVRAINSQNNTTPNFGREATAESVRLSATLLTDPDLSNNPIVNGAFGAFTNGVANSTTFNWNEVGIITLTPSLQSGNYLGTGVNVTGTPSGNVGRFYVHHFGFTPHPTKPLLNRADTSCTSCLFTYMGERLDAQFSLSAQALNNSTTQNYQGAYAKLNLAAAGNPLGFGAVEASGPTYLSTRLSIPSSASGSFSLGLASSIVAPLSFSRGAMPDGPYNLLRIGIAPVDADGAGLGGFDLDADAALAGNDHALLGTTSMRYGRIRLANAHGSELLQLPIALVTQYWNGSGYITNRDDNDTLLNTANILFSNYQRNLNSGETTVAPITPPLFVNGVGQILLSAPGLGNDGSVDLSSNAPSYLPSMTTRATFGIYKGGPLIYQRENY